MEKLTQKIYAKLVEKADSLSTSNNAEIIGEVTFEEQDEFIARNFTIEEATKFVAYIYYTQVAV